MIWPVVLQRPRHDFETNISPCDPTLHIIVRLFIYHLTSELNFNERLSKFLNWFMHCPELCAKWIAVLYRLDSFFSRSLHIRPPGRIFLYLKENYSKRNLKFHFIILRGLRRKTMCFYEHFQLSVFCGKQSRKFELISVIF